MGQFVLKTVISALIIAIVSTISKKVPFIGALIISLPITSMLAILWLYSDTKDSSKVIDLSNSITLMIVPSVVFFIALTILLKNNIKFYYSLAIASVIMIITYAIYTFILSKFGIKL